MKTHPDNPYQDEKGNPQPGKLTEFIAFQRDKELERRDDLSDVERQELEASDRHMADKMRS